MERHELERWLSDPAALPLSPFATADALGLPADALADTTLLRTFAGARSLAFILAVLRDAFASDLDMWRWLEASRSELNGESPRDALLAGSASAVEALAVQAWNETICMAGAA
jgi:hypothetical protein